MNTDDPNLIEFATKVVIALVKSPSYVDPTPDEIDSQLKNFFSTIKTFSLGDFFFIPNIINSSNEKTLLSLKLI